MEIFINECSFHEQIHNRSELNRAFRLFFSTLNLLNKRGMEHTLYRDGALFYIYKVMEEEAFIASLHSLPDKSLKQALINMLNNKLNARDWTLERIHTSDDVFMCEDDLVTDTGMAELAERMILCLTLSGLLINFPGSKYAGCVTVSVVKNEETTSDLDCVQQTGELETWLEANLQLSRYEYDASSTIPPTELQTVLRDNKRFKRTARPRQGGRPVYHEFATKYYWYIDSLHFGGAAHIEVFDSKGAHVGEADLNGDIDKDRRDPRKKIEL